LESLRRANRALVFFRPANGAAHCRRAPGRVPDFLIISGNLSFLNYLTIIPFLACFDDSFLGRFLPRSIVRRAQHAAQNSQPSRVDNGIAVALTILVIWLSIPTVLNLTSAGS